MPSATTGPDRCYPAALFDDLAELAGVGPGCRVLEIGPGTGKATVDLAHGAAASSPSKPRPQPGGCRPGQPRRRGRCAGLDEVVVSAFETWPLPPEPFDVVLAATAYHWLDPAVRVGRIAAALRPGGTLAVVETHHIEGGDVGFFVDVQRCYERWDPATPPDLRLPAPEQIPRLADTDHSGLFEPAVFRRYEWDQPYTTAGYLDLLLTYSNHRALPDQGPGRVSWRTASAG